MNRSLFKLRVIPLALALGAILPSGTAAAAGRDTIDLAGTQTSASNGSQYSGTVDLLVRVFTAPSAGTAVQSECFSNLAVTGGKFDVKVGSVNPFSPPLGVVMGDQPEPLCRASRSATRPRPAGLPTAGASCDDPMGPRLQLAASPYAGFAAEAATIVNGNVSLAADPVNSNDAATKQYVDTKVASVGGGSGGTGTMGPTGAVGATGSIGARGTTGSTGATGGTGSPGATGATGSPGATGTTGSPGATGATGSRRRKWCGWLRPSLGLAAGAIPYATSSTTVGTDPANLVWDSANKRLGLGTSTPIGILDVEGGIAGASTAGAPISLIAQSSGAGNSNERNIVLLPGAGSGTGLPGAVGIGTPAPQALLDVSGQFRAGQRRRGGFSNSTASINWNMGNVQSTTLSCGSFTFQNMLDGATYTLAVLGVSPATCSFTESGLTFVASPLFRRPPAVAARSSALSGSERPFFVNWETGY